MKRQSTIGSFDLALKSHYDYWSRPHTPKEQARDEERARYVQALRDEWDGLRAQLLPCAACGATSDDLSFQCAQLASMAYVFCTKCGRGCYEKGGPGPCWLEGDARPLAVERWNYLAQAERERRTG